MNFSIFLVTFVFCKLLYAAEISFQDNESFLVAKREVLKALLIKFDQPRFSAIPWEKVRCDGWPTNVHSKLSKHWSPKDVKILKESMHEIEIYPNFFTYDHIGEDCERIQKGTYSNFTFDQFSERYKIISVLGSGGFGFVFKCERLEDSRLCAVKFILKFGSSETYFAENPSLGKVPIEVDILFRIKHPGIVEFLDLFDDGIYAYMVVECFGTNWDFLNRRLSPERNPGLKTGKIPKLQKEQPHHLGACISFHTKFSDDIILYIFSQIYEIVCFLRQNRIFHRDLKPENILINADYRIKLIDFGISKILKQDNESLKGRAGSQYFLAPEAFREEPFQPAEAEVWALGGILFTMKTRSLPKPENLGIVSDGDGVRDLMSKMLVKEPKDRIKLEEIAEHPWMSQVDRVKLHFSAKEIHFKDAESFVTADAEADITADAKAVVTADAKTVITPDSKTVITAEADCKCVIS